MTGHQEWPETKHVKVLIESIRAQHPANSALVVSFTGLDGTERAVWDNGCYYESFRFSPESSDWTAETIEEVEAWPEDVEEAYGRACLYLGEMGERPSPAAPPPSIWTTRSDLDGYFVAVFISPSGDVEAARKRAWEIYTGRGNRPDLELPSDTEPGWKGYHSDPRGLVVFEVGDGYVGSNGEGRLEVDDAGPAPGFPGAPMRCEETHPSLGRCVLPIGHGSDFDHDWEDQ